MCLSPPEPNSKVLHFFRNHCQFTSLDVADLDLTAVTCGPAFQALGSHCHALSSLSLKGSQLGDAAMAELASSLSHVSTLSELNLSRTGITAQVMIPLVSIQYSYVCLVKVVNVLLRLVVVVNIINNLVC